jgi:hypothetical protein
VLHAGLDLSRKRLDICLLSEHGGLVEEFSAVSDSTRKLWGVPRGANAIPPTPHRGSSSTQTVTSPSST